MEITKIDSLLTAFIRPKEGANVGLVHTSQGLICIDTTSSPSEAWALFEALKISLAEVRLVINTHYHSDHTWGNQLFNCPILAHRACKELMSTALESDWSQGELQAYLSKLERSRPQKAARLRRSLEGLRVKLPDQLFEDQFHGELAGVEYEVIHTGGHSPDFSMVWLPGKKILYASDLIFQGRYPYIFDADVPAWVAALDHLHEFKADVIIPGHGVICGEAEIMELRDYLLRTWELAKEHIHLGHSVKETIADKHFPVFPGEKYGKLHRANIRYMYNQLVG